MPKLPIITVLLLAAISYSLPRAQRCESPCQGMCQVMTASRHDARESPAMDCPSELLPLGSNFDERSFDNILPLVTPY